MSSVTRRDLLEGSMALVGGWLVGRGDAALAGVSAADQTGGQRSGTGETTVARQATGPYELPELPYDYADLEPHIDAQTVRLHHDVHHKAYVENANAAVAELERIRRVGGDEIRRVGAVTGALCFNLAGHILHSVYWSTMKRDGGGAPPAGSNIARLIERDFGHFESFAAQFSAAANQVQGSGWGILAYEPISSRLLVVQAEKHENRAPAGVVPLLAIDVWEHAYYLKYQNQRASYIKAFMNLVNWDEVERRLVATMQA